MRGIVDFEYCKITDSADFSDLKLDPSVKFIFQATEFPHFFDLSQLVNIPTEIDLTVANFAENTQDNRIFICLYNTDVSKIKMDYSHFTLWLPDSIRYKMGRSVERFSSEDKVSIYESLLNNFKSRGQLESYERLDHEYRDYRSRRHWYLRLLALINRIWWNDGYTKGLVFFWAVIFNVIFTTINFFILSKLNEHVYEMENLPSLTDMKIATKWWYSLIYTVGIFFSPYVENGEIEV
ncbi:hypothetical protein GCM10011511_48090 [Puia dinghuensis]|uniref:Uncharacterized protein n=1 Tax=Puia dinghuensis TaxID=1792502 RepID=A0A8J2UI09_9BACT|nr:hypothetical protein GCM10011511_48090 [Puia dinghuensis]